MIINLHSYIYIYIIYIIYDGRGCTVRCANFLILHWFTINGNVHLYNMIHSLEIPKLITKILITKI